MSQNLSDTIVVISDFRDGWPPADPALTVGEAAVRWRDGRRGPPPGASATPSERLALGVTGGYLERLPLAAVKRGLVGRAEIWHHWRAETPPPFVRESPLMARRAFHLDAEDPPFASTDMLGFITAFGPPKILCVWGLGIDEQLMQACSDSFKIYNSIDAPAIRVPDPVSRHFDLVLTGADWQSEAVRARHPDMRCAVMPIGPEFADPQTFRPLGIEKLYDVVYVAAAQAYKRHDILFDALERRPGTSALCVFGYGELADPLREEAARRSLDVTFVGPPGVPFAEVNRLMNQARIGVVCGVDDGAPAILSEYMLAGLPVLANAGLRCGLHTITPDTGLAMPPERFAEGIDQLLAAADTLNPRGEAMARWIWPHSIARLATLMHEMEPALAAPVLVPVVEREPIMANETHFETGARKLAESHTNEGSEFNQKAAENKKPSPYGLTEANDEGAGLALESHEQDKAHPDPKKSDSMGKGGGGTTVEKDARGQFVQSQHGRENSGVSSASPRVTTGTDDATFENDPGQ